MPILPGDILLLFYTFPFDFDTDLPIGIGPAVFAGFQELMRQEYQTSLSILLPFEVSNGSDKILSPTLYNLRSSWQWTSSENSRYNGSLIDIADRVARRILEIRDQKRLFTAFNLFTQVTVGMVSSLQMAVMGLFAALESLFVPKGNYARTLAKRVAEFLSSVQFPMGISDWLELEYIHRRSTLIHGIPDVLPSGMRPTQQGQGDVPTGNARALAFGRLHELVRLSILGFLSLPDQAISEHSASNGTRLQGLIENLGPAQGEFIAQQAVWCD